jgi:diguanylate cyclase (GGDEF)-like protein
MIVLTTFFAWLATFVAMRRAVADRTRARQETAIVVAQLELRICELQQRSREISLLADMSEMLHLSSTALEAIDIVPSFGQRLFPTFDGAIYLADASSDFAELSSWWGTQPDAHAFATSDCRALTHFGNSAACAHHRDGDASERLCVPMLAFGEAIGLLTLRAVSPATSAATVEVVAKAFSDQLSLGIASLRMQETLRTRAVRDALTGLFNRHYLEDTLAGELQRCRRAGTPVSVVIIDIDWFKSFNDTFGHPGGDALLQQFARLAQQVFRDEDVVCRYGGEEFVAMLPNTRLDAAVACANRLREQVRHLAPHLGDRQLGNVTISAGVASAPGHGIDADRLLSAADAALYAAKNAGRDRVLAAAPINVIAQEAA